MSKSIFSAFSSLAVWKQRELMRRIGEVFHALMLWLRNASHITAAPTLAGLQAALPGSPQVPSELGQGGWWQAPTAMGALPHWQPAQVAPLTKEDVPCKTQRKSWERQIAQEDHLFYTNISLYQHSSALELSVLLLCISRIKSRVLCSN